MKFFLDTANIDEIKKYVSWGVVDGVTTNPSLIAKEGVSLESRIKEIVEVVDGPISTEVLATETSAMLEEARKYVKWHKNICIKLPTTEAGVQALHVLAQEGVKVNMTLVFSPSQALLVAKAGAAFVSPFIGRLDDISQDGMDLIAEIMEVYENYPFETEVIVASVRHPRHVIESARLGADVITMPPAVLGKLIKHPMTDIGLKKFLSDWEQVKNLQQ